MCTKQIKYSIYIFDNGSQKSEIYKLVQLKNQGLIDHLYVSNKNLGFSVAMNILAKESKNGDFCCVNNDCFVNYNWLNELMKCIKLSKNVAAVCSTTNQHQNVKHDEFIEIETLYGALMYFSRDAWNDVGYFDYKNFSPAYSEELDWSYRAKNRGYKLIQSIRSKAHHLESATANKKFKFNIIHQIRLTHRIKCRLMNYTIIKMIKFWKTYIKEILEEYKNHTLHIYLIAIRNNIQILPHILSERKKRFRLEKIDFNFQYRIVKKDSVKYIISP